MDVTASTVIRRSPHDVFAYVFDARNDVYWRTAVTGSGLRTPGPAAVGSVGFAVAGSVESVYRITSLEPETSVDWEFVEGPFGGTGGYRLAAVEGGTRFTLTGDVRPTGALRLLGPVFAWLGRRHNRADVERLRSILEE